MAYPERRGEGMKKRSKTAQHASTCGWPVTHVTSEAVLPKYHIQAVNKPAKARSGKAVTPKGRNALMALSCRGAVPAHEAEVARLARERDEALDQQAAITDILQAKLR